MPPKLGILAGAGDMPARLVETCRDTGREFFVLAFDGQTDPGFLADIPHAWVRLGAAGRGIELLRAAGARDLVMAGSIQRPSLSALRPDSWAARLIAKAGVRAFGDDGLLSMIVRELEETEGFRVVGPQSILPDILATAGTYGTIQPDSMARRDIDRGIVVAKAIGALDVGQAAVVQEGMVLAVEAAEGTDAMLERCRDVRRDGPGGVLVKVRKPRQEDRADLPTIGVSTIANVAAAGLAGIAVEAGGTLIIDRPAVIAAGDSAGLFLIGIEIPEDICG